MTTRFTLVCLFLYLHAWKTLHADHIWREKPNFTLYWKKIILLIYITYFFPFNLHEWPLDLLYHVLHNWREPGKVITYTPYGVEKTRKWLKLQRKWIMIPFIHLSLIHIGSKHSEWPLETPSHDLKVSKMLAKPSTFAQYCVEKKRFRSKFPING